MRIRDIGEIELIKRLSGNFRLDHSVIKGSGDDTAVLKWTDNKYLLFTCDMLLQGVHFDLSKATPFQIGWKALGRNVSDIAAMGGIPRHTVISMAIDPELDVSVAEGICKGFKSIADRFGINIVGGDMAESKNMAIDVSMLGEARKKNLTLRSTARKGDMILVTGSLGGSIKGKHLNFMPRVRESQTIVNNFKVNSMIDISDGLALDLNRIITASDAGAFIYEESIPLSKDARSLDNGLYDGEDYELLFTMPAKEAEKLLKANFSRFMTRISLIGEVVDRKHGYKIVRENGKEEGLKVKGYTHF